MPVFCCWPSSHCSAGCGGTTWPAWLVGAKWFIPVWVGIALVNMWVGVTKAGYTVAQELPILGVVIAVPAVLALLLAWQVARG